MEATSVPGDYVCDMPVFFFPKTTNFSYGIGVTATVFWYYIASAIYVDIKNGGSGGGVVGWSIGLYFVILLLQLGGLYVQSAYSKCSVTMLGVLISWLIGFLVGILFFVIIRTTNTSYLPYMGSTTESFTSQTFLSGGVGKAMPSSMIKTDGSSEPQDSEQSSKPDDKDEFVCDLYKNGQLITSTISE
jgi:hypothetical protein